MMKKWLIWFMAAAMAFLPLMAEAEDAPYLSYVSQDGSISFLYPDTWTLLSQENLDTVLDIAQNMEELSGLMDTARAQIEQYGMILLMSEDYLSNINLILQNVGAEMTSDLLLAAAPSIQTSISSSISGVSFDSDPEIMDINGRPALLIQYGYVVSGVELFGVQVYMSVGTQLCLCTLTTSVQDASDELEAMGVILGSFQLV